MNLEKNICFIPPSETQKVIAGVSDPIKRASILSDIFRFNTLSMIMYAGSGHIGSSFSAMDIITWLWTEELNNPNGKENNSDTYFSSKGHDVPGLYSLLIGLGKLDSTYLKQLRRLGGLPGHPDITIPFLITNTGPLGMGISKAKGMLKANRLNGKEGRFFVLTGDGELQEGQIWESLQQAANEKLFEITVIVDHNKIQSDTYVESVSDLGDLEKKFASFGWAVSKCDGHSFESIRDSIAYSKTIKDRPQIIIADTKKGAGVSFMELMSDDGYYKFHSGAPSVELYKKGIEEIIQRIQKYFLDYSLPTLVIEEVERPVKITASNPEKLVSAYGDELLKIAEERKDIVALDADLVLDTGLIPFKNKFPERFVECGIAEQDMVSQAGGFAIKNMLPVVHSFACFLSTRPNEQIYNNATEQTKIIYVGSLAGMLPSGPGHSHQSVRDISCLGSIPKLTLIEPCNEEETRKAIRWAVEKNKNSTYIRLVSIPYDIPFRLPPEARFEEGEGTCLKEGKDLAIISYGPIMLSEIYKAATKLEQKGVSVAVFNFPWLNKLNDNWFEKNLAKYKKIVTFDNHYVLFGQGNVFSAKCAQKKDFPTVISFGLTEVPVCGLNHETLAYYGFDCDSLVTKIQSL